MKVNPQILMVCAIILLLAFMGHMAYRAYAGGFGQLAALPMAAKASASFESLDEANENHAVLLTYEYADDTMVDIAGQNHRLRTVYVNYVYPYVMRYPVLSGGFFSRDAQENKLAHVTLNKTAAFDLFGGINIVGCVLTLNRIPCTVTGVIDDGDEDNRHLYAPAHLSGAGAAAQGIIAAIENPEDAPRIVNALKDAGVTETGYTFYNLNEYCHTVIQKFYLGIGVVLLALLGWGSQCSIRRMQYHYRIRMNHSTRGTRLLNASEASETRDSLSAVDAMRNTILWGLLSAAMLGCIAAMGRFLLPLGMHWYDYPTPEVWDSPVIQQSIRSLYALGILSDGGFIAVCMLTVLCWIFAASKERQ